MEIEEKIIRLEEKLNKLPDGNLLLVNSKGYAKWYCYHKKNKKYIPKKERKFAEKLALKKYISETLADLKDVKKVNDLYLEKYPLECRVDKLFANNEMKQLLSGNYAPISEELAVWQSEEYESNPFFNEYLTYECVSGNIVRSKSESILLQLMKLLIIICHLKK